MTTAKLRGARVLRRFRRGNRRYAEVGMSWTDGGGSTKYGTSPAHSISKAIRDALTPEASPVRTLADMTPEERAAIAAQYGAPIKPR